MTQDRIDRWLTDLASTLELASELSLRGREAFDSDPAVPLAFEALSIRVGDIVKRLVASDSDRFSDLIWSQAARNRDFVVHYYDRLDPDLLWSTIIIAFPELARVVDTERSA